MSCWRSCCGSFWANSSSSSSSSNNNNTNNNNNSSNISDINSNRTVSTQSWEEEEEEDAVEVVEPNNLTNNQINFQPHTEMNADILAKKWITHVQKRAAKIWEREQVLSLLRNIALSVSFTDDPILGDPSPSAPCVLWHGDTSSEQGLPVIQVQKSGQEKKAPSYVAKLLSFLFADDESLKILKQMGGGQISMNCGNNQCIRLSHFVGYTQKWASKYQPPTKAKTTAKSKAKTPPKK